MTNVSSKVDAKSYINQENYIAIGWKILLYSTLMSSNVKLDPSNKLMISVFSVFAEMPNSLP